MAKKIAVFASGNGSNFQVIAEQFPVEFVFSDHRDAYVLERAKNLGVPIHPAYLPEFPGAHGIEDAWNAGVAESGVTIHWVDSGVDTGKVIKQVRVPRLEGDTLDTFETRIHETEYKLYPEVLERLGVERK